MFLQEEKFAVKIFLLEENLCSKNFFTERNFFTKSFFTGRIFFKKNSINNYHNKKKIICNKKSSKIECPTWQQDVVAMS